MRASEANAARRDSCSFVRLAVRQMNRKRIVCCISKRLLGNETRALFPTPFPTPRCVRATIGSGPRAEDCQLLVSGLSTRHLFRTSATS
eukprot:6169923-Pyramimonas_sp.AAC.1